MSPAETETCPGCGATLDKIEGLQHPYIGASPSCWAIYTAMANAGSPGLQPDARLALLVDAYAAQHPGQPSDQSIQSVAVHLLTLYGVLEAGYRPDQALWLRRRPLRDGRTAKHARFTWLEPPALHLGLTVEQIAAGPSPQERTRLAKQYIDQVWQAWKGAHQRAIQGWFGVYVLGDLV
jgi:hypothetical protein